MSGEVQQLQADVDRSMFVDDKELHRRINPKLGWDRFRAAVRAMEDKGFPPVKPLWGGRFWPAVVAWLFIDNGMRDHGSFTADAQFFGAEDGQENFDAPAQRPTRPEAGTSSPALLDRAPGRARPDGIPRRLHSVAGRRG